MSLLAMPICAMSYSLLALLAGIVLAMLASLLFYITKKDRIREIKGRLEALPSLPARQDLPTAVALLAQRLGVGAGQTSAYVRLHQTGVLMSRPDSTPMVFVAEQHIGTVEVGFLWSARMGPFGLLQVRDYLLRAQGGLLVWLGMLVELLADVDTPEILLGERLRYLAELPFNPDAILYNPHLRWTVADEHTLQVALGEGAAEAKVSFHLTLEGLIDQVNAAERPYKTRKGYISVPWRGKFADYAPHAGRLIPHRAEVGWELESGLFVYWRGRVDRWEAHPTQSPIA